MFCRRSFRKVWDMLHTNCGVICFDRNDPHETLPRVRSGIRRRDRCSGKSPNGVTSFPSGGAFENSFARDPTARARLILLVLLLGMA